MTPKRSKRTIDNNRLRRLTSLASVSVAVTLVLVKGAAFWVTDSVAMLSSLVDSGVDLVASLITAYGVVLALRPPDRDHRYGHGKAESLAALAQGVFIFASAFLLIAKAFERLLHPAPLHNTTIGYLVMGLAIFLTTLLISLQTYTIQRTNSLAISSDRLHYVGDIFVNSAVMATFAFQEWLDLSWADPIFALVIAAILSIGGYKIVYASIRILMDAELPAKEREKIRRIVCATEGVRGIHDLRTRTASGHPIITVHVEMDPFLTLVKAHEIAEKVEAAIKESFPHADVTIHQDPLGIKEDRLDTLIEGDTAKDSDTAPYV